MSERNEKVRVALTSDKDGEATVLLGSHFHTLEDKTQVELSAPTIPDLLTYLETRDVHGTIFTTIAGLQAIDDTRVDRYTIPVASVKLGVHPILLLLQQNQNTPMSPSEFEELLLVLKPYLASNSLDALGLVRSLRVQKVVNIQRHKDDRGNFAFEVKSESGVDEMEFPNTISFTVPVLAEHDHDPYEETFTFTFVFDYSVDEDKVQMVYTLRNPQIQEEIRLAMRRAIEQELTVAPDTWNVVWGELHISKGDTGWMYKSNGVD